jgi:hypothetical protein
LRLGSPGQAPQARTPGDCAAAANAPELPCRLALDLSNLLNSLLAVLFKPAASTDREWVFGKQCRAIETGLMDGARNSLRVVAMVVDLRQGQEDEMGLFRPRGPFRELRSSPRHEIHYLAQIDRDGASPPLSCVIWDISASGAKLTVADEQSIPDEFTLLLRRRCHVVRRYEGQIGVQFKLG